MRTRFDEQREMLNRDMITMGMLCESAIKKTNEALLKNDLKLVESITELQDPIARKEREIESLALQLILKQQPVASDLRVVSSALKIVTDMQRIGDQSVDIAEIIRLGNTKNLQEDLNFEGMSDAVTKMVSGSIDAFVKNDAKLAQTVVEYDDVVDEHFNRIKQRLVELLQSGIVDAEALIDLLMIAKYYERIGDHAVNIANWVLYSITGEIQ